MRRLMEFDDDFAKMPPTFEILRTQVLMPGDKDYKKPDPTIAKRVIQEAIRDDGAKEPEWMRNARIKLEERRKKGAGAKRWQPTTVR